MSLTLNIRHLEVRTVAFEGAMDCVELALDGVDELVRPAGPLNYAFEAVRHERGILLQGVLGMDFSCECARCLTPFPLKISLDPWVSLLPWEGEDAVVVTGDFVDLTPYLREDMVLALPQRPLCKPECGGLPGRTPASMTPSKTPNSWDGPAPAWQELDKLRF
jgi:uncharacterized protein